MIYLVVYISGMVKVMKAKGAVKRDDSVLPFVYVLNREEKLVHDFVLSLAGLDAQFYLIPAERQRKLTLVCNHLMQEKPYPNTSGSDYLFDEKVSQIIYNKVLKELASSLKQAKTYANDIQPHQAEHLFGLSVITTTHLRWLKNYKPSFGFIQYLMSVLVSNKLFFPPKAWLLANTDSSYWLHNTLRNMSRSVLTPIVLLRAAENPLLTEKDFFYGFKQNLERDVDAPRGYGISEKFFHNIPERFYSVKLLDLIFHYDKGYAVFQNSNLFNFTRNLIGVDSSAPDSWARKMIEVYFQVDNVTEMVAV